MAFNIFRKKPKLVGGTVEKSDRNRNYLGYIMGSGAATGIDAMHAYQVAPWARALTDKIADTVATSFSTIKLYESEEVVQNSQGQAGMPIYSHPFLTFIKRGCDEMSGHSAMQVTMKMLHLDGACAWHIVRSVAGKPLKFKPVQRSWVSDVGTSYEVRYPNGENVSVDYQDVCFFWNHNPENPYDTYGTSVIQTLAAEFDTDREAAQALRNGYKNNLTPSLMVGIDDASEEEMERIYNEMSQNQGSSGWGSTFFTNRKLSTVQLQQNLGQIPIIEHRKFSRDNAIQVHGVPLEMLGVSENSNRATIEGAEYIFYRSTIIPKLDFIIGEIQRKILWEMFGADDLVIKYESPLPDNEESKRLLMTARPDAFRKNEFREAAGLPPLTEEDGGFDFPISIDPYNPKPRDITPASGTAPSPEKSFGGGMGAVSKSLSVDEINTILASVSYSDIANAEDFRKFFEDLISDFGSEQADEIIAQAARVYAFNPQSLEIARQVSASIQTLSVTVGDVFNKKMADILTESVGQRLGVRERAALIKENFGTNDARAMRIARTETNKAANFARDESARQSGMVKWKTWKHQNAASPDKRDNHVDLHNKVIPFGDMYTLAPFMHGRKAVPADFAKHPTEFIHLENNVNCNCISLYTVKKPSAAKTASFDPAITKAVNDKQDKYMKRLNSMMEKISAKYAARVIEVLDEAGL